MEEMRIAVISAVVGAIAGAVVGGIVSFFIARMQIDAARQLSNNENCKGKVREVSSAVSKILSEILSPSTSEILKREGDLNSLRHRWEEIEKQIIFSGYKNVQREFSECINPYLGLLKRFADGEIKPNELEQQRKKVRDRVEKTMQKWQE
jgi:hypothetical protein